MNLRFAFILVLFSFSIVIAQKTYYVSNDGDYNNDGLTEETAWETIGKVNSESFSPGDIIAFERGGTYDDEYLDITHAGTSGNEIVFTAYGSGAKPIIGKKTSTAEQSIKLYAEYVILDNLTIYGTASGTDELCNGVALGADHTKIENCYFEGGDPNSTNGNITNIVHNNKGRAVRIMINSFTDIEISNNEIAYWGGGIYFYKPNGIIINHNEFYQIHLGEDGHQNEGGGDGGVCIMFAGRATDGSGWDCNYNVVISNNEFYEYERWGIAMSSMSNAIVEKNVFHDNLDETIYSGGVSHGNAVKLHDRRSGPVLGDGSVGSIFRYNVIHDLGRHQTGYTYQSNYGGDETIGSYGSVVAPQGVDCYIHNNLVYDCGGGLVTTDNVYISGETVSSADYWLEVYNNTCYNISNDNLSSASIKLEVDRGTNYPPKMKFKNNIIFDGSVTLDRPIIAAREELNEGDNIIMNDVAYFYDDDNIIPTENYYIWERWSNFYTLEGDLTLLNTDPKFNNVNGTVFLPNIGVDGVTVPDFRLLDDTSPAYNGGADVGNDPSGIDMSIDIQGNLRTTNDVGALGIAASNSGGSRPQQPITPVITQQPINQSVSSNSSISFSVSATCNAPIGYQWWKHPFVSVSESKIKDNSKYSGVTTNTLIINDVNSDDNNTQYVCEVYNTQDPSNHWVNSDVATLTVTSNSFGSNFKTPVITKQPKSITVNENEDVSFTVEATCDDDIGYQWWKSPFISEAESKIANSTKYSGVTTNQLTVKSVHASDANVSYECEVYNKSDRNNLQVNSNVVGLTVQETSNISELKVVLEGPFQKNGMLTLLNSKGFLPTIQPYDFSPFNYAGFQKVETFTNNIIDWILIELRSDKNTSVKQFAALLRNDGIVLNVLGEQDFTNHNISDGNYFLVIHHRNHLSIMSKTKISIKNSIINYNFSTNKDKTYGTNSMVKLENGSFAMYSGNSDANNIINKLDFGFVANNIFTTGYESGDIDMNGIINVLDYSNINKNISVKSNVP